VSAEPNSFFTRTSLLGQHRGRTGMACRLDTSSSGWPPEPISLGVVPRSSLDCGLITSTGRVQLAGAEIDVFVDAQLRHVSRNPPYLLPRGESYVDTDSKGRFERRFLCLVDLSLSSLSKCRRIT